MIVTFILKNERAIYLPSIFLLNKQPHFPISSPSKSITFNSRSSKFGRWNQWGMIPITKIDLSPTSSPTPIYAAPSHSYSPPPLLPVQVRVLSRIDRRIWRSRFTLRSLHFFRSRPGSVPPPSSILRPPVFSPRLW